LLESAASGRKLQLSRMLLTNYACGRSSWPMKLTISSAVLKADQRRRNTGANTPAASIGPETRTGSSGFPTRGTASTEMAQHCDADMVRAIVGARQIRFLSGLAGSQSQDALAEARWRWVRVPLTCLWLPLAAARGLGWQWGPLAGRIQERDGKLYTTSPAAHAIA
jgi:hypothetical protein